MHHRLTTTKQATLFALLLSGLLASGCAVRYGPRIPGIQPGYTDQRIGESTYQVKVGEAWPKDWPDMEKFAMYRAAEITRSAGKRYFVVLNATTQTINYHISSPAYSTTTGTVTRQGNAFAINATTVTTPGTAGTISGGWYTLDFKALDDSELAAYPRVVDALQLQSELRYFIQGRR